MSRRLAGRRRRHHARGRARHHCLGSFLGDAGGRDRAAIPVHHQQVAGIAARTKFALQTLDITRQYRLDAGVHGSCHAALVFPRLGEKRMPHGDVIGKELGQDLARAPLMSGVRIGVQEMHDDRLAARAFQALARDPHGLFVKRHHHLAGRIHPLGHFEPEGAGDDGRELALHAIGLGTRPAAQFQHVAKAFGRHQTGPRQLALQHGVGRGRGAVHDQVHRARVDPGLLESGQNAKGLILGRRGHLGQPHLARGGVDLDEVGKCAADIDPDHPPGPLFRHRRYRLVSCRDGRKTPRNCQLRNVLDSGFSDRGIHIV